MYIYIPYMATRAVRPSTLLVEDPNLKAAAQSLLNDTHAKITALYHPNLAPTQLLDTQEIISELITKLKRKPALLRQLIHQPGSNSTLFPARPMYLVSAQMIWRPSFWHFGVDQDRSAFSMQLWAWFKEMPEIFAFDRLPFDQENNRTFANLIGQDFLGKVTTEELITTIQKLSRRHSNEILGNLAYYFYVYGLDGRFDAQQISAMHEFLNCMRFSGVCTESEFKSVNSKLGLPLKSLAALYREYIQEALDSGAQTDLAAKLKALKDVVSEENKLVLAHAIVDKLGADFDPLVATQKAVLAQERKRIRHSLA